MLRAQNIRGFVALAALLGLFLGCAQSQPTGTGSTAPEADVTSNSPLVGTWRLVKFQSMDDAIGTLTPEADQTYTMTLDADGAAQFVLNCNRASGTYTSTASSETSGQLEFGPVAMTRALCPPPSLDERIAADLGFVRSYVLKDGRLHLSLMADGGIYSFEPAIDG